MDLSKDEAGSEMRPNGNECQDDSKDEAGSEMRPNGNECQDESKDEAGAVTPLPKANWTTSCCE
jgi:hypothetical protein